MPHTLNDYRRAERVIIAREPLEMLNNGEHRILSKPVTVDETYIRFYDIPTHQESRVWIHKEALTLTMAKKQRATNVCMQCLP